MSVEAKVPLTDVSKRPVDQAVRLLILYAVMLPANDVFITTNEQSVSISARHL